MQAPICEHIKTDGKRCGAVATRNQHYCYYHMRYHRRTELPTGHTDYRVPVFEDSRSILLGIHQTIEAGLSGNLDPRLCSLALYGYQVAASVIQRRDARSPLDEEKLEAEARAQAEMKLKAKPSTSQKSARDDREEEENDEQPNLAGHLLQTLLEIRSQFPPSNQPQTPPLCESETQKKETSI
ncbi:MAG TPA: hypothetical protein VN577_09515 [Terriglobales bacterium]|nr:hypothetical protein [Terriglobales bacterium]